MSRVELRPFGVATAHTAAVIHAVPDSEAHLWDFRPSPNVKTLRELLAHIALIRESVICTLTNRDPAALKTIFESGVWVGEGATEELSRAWELHTRRCQIMLADLHTSDLGKPFQTEFGNVSTPENYLRLMLLEETHHRAQMILLLRLFELEAPDFPGRAWAELNM